MTQPDPWPVAGAGPRSTGKDELAQSLAAQQSAATRLDLARFTMWLFLVAEVMFFTAFFGAFLVWRGQHPRWPLPQVTEHVLLPTLNLAPLLLSSLTLELARRALGLGQRGGLKLWLLATTLLGTVFLGVQLLEYQRTWRSGVVFNSGEGGNYFYLLAGTHGVHVAGGILFLLLVLVLALRHRLHRLRRVPLDLCRMYWHFVVVIWLVLFRLLYFG
jgi:heme/copper-type cytochrome/quinol oxidase subunit 3